MFRDNREIDDAENLSLLIYTKSNYALSLKAKISVKLLKFIIPNTKN